MATMRKSNLPDRITRDLHINTKFEDEAPPAAPAPAAEAPAPAPAPPAAEAPPATPLAPAEAPPAAMESTNNNIPSSSIWKRIMIALWQLVQAYDFPILLLAFIGIAKAAPKFGAFDLAPQYTATWIAVALIFCKLSSRTSCRSTTTFDMPSASRHLPSCFVSQLVLLLLFRSSQRHGLEMRASQTSFEALSFPPLRSSLQLWLCIGCCL